MNEKVLGILIQDGRWYASEWSKLKEGAWVLGKDLLRQESKYFAVQKVYAAITGDVTAYSDFNEFCGVTVDNGEIVSFDPQKRVGVPWAK